jgi:hypothetical protein
VASSREYSLVQWPSVARCLPGQISTDREPCDQDNRTTHRHDNTVASSREYLQIEEQWRPVIKCKDPEHGNPISCDHDDITSYAPLSKDSNGFTPTKVVLGGPSFGMKEPEIVDEKIEVEGETSAQAPAKK